MNIRQLFRRQRPADGPRLADDGTLPVVGSSFDPGVADSVVIGQIADRGIDLTRPMLLRYHLRLPDHLAVEEARRILAQEGYALHADEGEPAEDGLQVRVSRPQQITALAVAQERSRMVALVQRLEGHVAGWDLLAAR
jgi:Regulator of ribonuclease activity B